MPSFSNSPSARPSEGPSSQPTINSLVNLGGNPNYYTDFVWRTWSECESLALRENLDFATIHIGDTLPSSFGPIFWLGGYRDSSGAFVWKDGSPMDYLPWAPNEPNPIYYLFMIDSTRKFMLSHSTNTMNCLWTKPR